MKFLKRLLDTTTKKIVAISLLALLLIWIILFFVARDTAIGLLKPLLWTFLLVAVCWLAIHFGLKAWRKRKRSDFDEKVAAKEGIEDRKREWSQWTTELEKQGIDRYELPFYLLVGEPQSGKSVLLHNSDLHFPFGQSRLSGVGGTRGCDWWFTEEAVILDLAGRLFTHEGGATDRLEFEAFLHMLYEFRPLVPANGVILVIPSDILLQDDAEECALKATKIQNALLTLTTKLQAQLPVYLVLTKADQIFGFAECVHRLDVEHRHQMFGWSREADKLDTPFDLEEVHRGFLGMTERARLLRGHMMAGARIPEALPEVDRMYAFPHELEGMYPNLEVYLKRIFTASNITDRVFFRGLYLTSGLQSGVPIAKVCTELFGQSGEADARNLEALFSKQRAYFIKDLIRSRIFGERGLVRPTQGRVQQTQRTSVVGYGISGAIVLLSVIFAIVYLATSTESVELQTYDDALTQTERVADEPSKSIPDLLYKLQLIGDAVEFERPAYEKATTSSKEDFEELYCALFDAQLTPLVKSEALNSLEIMLERGLRSHAEMLQVCDAVVAAIDGLAIDFSDSGSRKAVLAVLPSHQSLVRSVEGEEPLTLAAAFDRRDDYGPSEGMLAPLMAEDRTQLLLLARRALEELEGCLKPGAATQPGGELGYVLAWAGAWKARESLLDPTLQTSGKALQRAASFASSMQKLAEIEPTLPPGGAGRSIDRKDVFLQCFPLGKTYRPRLQAFLRDQGTGSLSNSWPELDEVLIFANRQFQGHEGRFNLSSFGLHFGSEDLGQTLFQESEAFVGGVQGKIVIGRGADYDPQNELRDPPRLYELCAHAMPRDFFGQGLDGLGAAIDEIDTTTLGATAPKQVVDAFLAELVELAEMFRKQLPDPVRAREALSSETPEEKRRPLSVRLVGELVRLHLSLGKLIKDRDLPEYPRRYLVDWQSHVESLLERHLRDSGPASAWVPPVPPEGVFAPEAWSLLESLGRAAELVPIQPQRNPVADTAGDVQREALLEMSQRLVDRWRARRADDLRQTVKTAEELSELARGVKTRLGSPQTLAGTDFDAWTGQVDTLLSARLEGVVKQLIALWEPELSDASLPALISSISAEMDSIQLKIDESNRQGMDGLAPILGALEEKGPVLTWLKLLDTSALLAELRQWRIPMRVSAVEGDEEYKHLDLALDRLGKASSTDGAFLAAEYADRFLVAKGPAAAANAGVRLVRRLQQRLAAKMQSEIQRAYLGDLRSALTSNANRAFYDMLFWEPGEDGLRLRNDEVRDAMEQLLKQAGEFDRLRERYSMGSGGPLQGVVFPETPAAGEDDLAALHRFLVKLQTFLLAGDSKGKSVRAATFDFWLDPATGATGSIWQTSALPPDEKRDWFWFPADESKEILQRAPILTDMGRLRVSKWGFDSNIQDRKVTFLWSRQPATPQTETGVYRYDVPSCLGPLLLAWSGRPIDDELLEYDVTFIPSGSNRPAPMRVIFDRPLPERPRRP